VTLTVIGPSSWVRVRNERNELLQDGDLSQGTVRTYSGRLLGIEVGNAGAVELVINGTPHRPLGPEGQVLRLSITPASR